MIELTRIDGTVFYVNPDLIEIMESAHDTHVTLTNGHRYVCIETPDQVIDRIAEFRRKSFGAVQKS